VKFGWVGADAPYDNNHGFLNPLEDAGERFMADIDRNHGLWVKHPVFHVPCPAEGKMSLDPSSAELPIFRGVVGPLRSRRCRDGKELHAQIEN